MSKSKANQQTIQEFDEPKDETQAEPESQPLHDDCAVGPKPGDIDYQTPPEATVFYREPSVAEIEKMLEDHILQSRVTARHLRAWLRAAKDRAAGFSSFAQRTLIE
jgi:hypothetical protein